jgi:hypothetical protein
MMLMTETGIVSDNASLCEAVPVCVPDFGSSWTNFAIYVNVKEFGCGQKANLSKKSPRKIRVDSFNMGSIRVRRYF